MAYKNQQYLRSMDARLSEALDDIYAQHLNVAKQVNAASNGNTSAPSPISALTVTAAGGIFDIAIFDNSPVSRGVNYFVEYSTTPAFNQPTAVDLGASRNYRATWGNQTLYFRAFSQYPTSAPSTPVYFGSPSSPTPVAGGGTATGPAPQASAGSGTAPSNGRTGGAGFGYDPNREGAQAAEQQF